MLFRVLKFQILALLCSALNCRDRPDLPLPLTRCPPRAAANTAKATKPDPVSPRNELGFPSPPCSNSVSQLQPCLCSRPTDSQQQFLISLQTSLHSPAEDELALVSALTLLRWNSANLKAKEMCSQSKQTSNLCLRISHKSPFINFQQIMTTRNVTKVLKLSI